MFNELIKIGNRCRYCQPPEKYRIKMQILKFIMKAPAKNANLEANRYSRQIVLKVIKKCIIKNIARLQKAALSTSHRLSSVSSCSYQMTFVKWI